MDDGQLIKLNLQKAFEKNPGSIMFMICKCCISTTGLGSFRPPGVGWSEW